MLTLFKSLADPTRLRLLAILAHVELPVQDLTAVLGMGQSRISRHLKILTESGLLRSKREGTWIFYRLEASTRLAQAAWDALREEFALLPGHAEDMRRLSGLLEQRRQQNRDFFNQHAGHWNDLAEQVLPMAGYREQLLAAVPVGTGSLLDVGTGTGRWLPQLAERALQVVAVDQSQAMLDQARQLLERSGRANVELRLGEMAHLPAADRTFDLVLMNMVLHHAQRPSAVLTEIARVVRPEGRLVIADLPRHAHDWAREALADLWLGFDAEELAGWLREAGFEPVERQLISGAEQRQDVFVLTAERRS